MTILKSYWRLNGNLVWRNMKISTVYHNEAKLHECLRKVTSAVVWPQVKQVDPITQNCQQFKMNNKQKCERSADASSGVVSSSRQNRCKTKAQDKRSMLAMITSGKCKARYDVASGITACARSICMSGRCQTLPPRGSPSALACSALCEAGRRSGTQGSRFRAG